jgi:Family of unknown function (DUF6152)
MRGSCVLMSVRSRAGAAAAALGVTLLWASMPVLAHHSFAMFDHDHQIKMSGTVTYFQWTNPHVYIDLQIDKSSPASARFPHFTIECANPGILDRVGWKWNMIRKGDHITVIVAPLKSGKAGGLLKQITLTDGHKFSNGPAAGKPNIQ